VLNRRQLIVGTGVTALATAMPIPALANINPDQNVLEKHFFKMIDHYFRIDHYFEHMDPSQKEYLNPLAKQITRIMVQQNHDLFRKDRLFECPTNLVYSNDLMQLYPSVCMFPSVHRSAVYEKAHQDGTRACGTAVTRVMKTGFNVPAQLSKVSQEDLAAEMVAEIRQHLATGDVAHEVKYGFKNSISYFSYMPVIPFTTIDLNTFIPRIGFKTRYGMMFGNWRILTAKEDMAYERLLMKRASIA